MVLFLAREDIKFSKTIVHEYMNQELQLYLIPAKKRPRFVEGAKHELLPNHLSEFFNGEEKNAIWYTDFTYIKGWDGKFNTTAVFLIFQTEALSSQKERPKGLILYSDQGSQFTSHDLIECCMENEVTKI